MAGTGFVSAKDFAHDKSPCRSRLAGEALGALVHHLSKSQLISDSPYIRFLLS